MFEDGRSKKVIFIAHCILKDNFANAVVYILEHFIYHDCDEAAVVYLKTFKRYEFWLFLLAILGVFFVAFRIFVGNVSKYFKEINRLLMGTTLAFFLFYEGSNLFFAYV